MSDLQFLSGVSENLPSYENREKGHVYYTIDDKKIFVNDLTLEDSEVITSNIKSYVDQEVGKLLTDTELKFYNHY